MTSNPFVTAIRSQADMTRTENNALTHVSSGSNVLDMFAAGGAWRNRSEADIAQGLELALLEDPQLALRCLFYLRDIRGGQGERRIFRVGLQHLAAHHPNLFKQVFAFAPEYGRWDDLLSVSHAREVQLLLLSLLQVDQIAERPSLLAKWLPSENTASKATRAKARELMKAFGWTPRKYRKALSALREKLRVLERDLCAKRYGSIIYEHVPSKAALRYRKAFKKRDEQRYVEYLAKVKSGEKKINAGTLYPYDLVHEAWSKPGDETVDLQWAALPNYMEKPANALVMCDTSGSMASKIGPKSSVSAMEVSVSLAIYIAERNQGPFHNLYMTFSSRPQIVTVGGNTLYEKVHKFQPIVENTDLMAAFREILKYAKWSNATQEQLPQMLLVISDMEFDQCTSGGSFHSVNRENTNFQAAQVEFEAAGYKLPHVVFWNVCARGRQQPVTKHQSGATLVSGCSPSILKQIMNWNASPLELMLKTLNSERYAKITVGGNG
jgi:hypothetical protein